MRQITSRRATEVSFWFLNANLFVERLRVKKSLKCTRPTLIWEQRYFLFPLFLKLPSFPFERAHFTGTESLSFAWVTFVPENLVYSKTTFFLTRQLFALFTSKKVKTGSKLDTVLVIFSFFLILCKKLWDWGLFLKQGKSI